MAGKRYANSPVDSGEYPMKQVSTGFIEKPTAVTVHRAYKVLHPDRSYAVFANEVGTYDVMQVESSDLDDYDETDGEIGHAWGVRID
jgi:hypothetical protein